MKNNVFIYALIALTFILFSCDKEEYNTYENPHWAVTSYEGLSVSCTIVMDLPDNIKPYQGEDDVVAAFIDGECRGVSNLQNGLFYIIVSASADEVANIDLKYYNASNKYMYQVAEQIPFEINKRIGTTDEPFVPTFVIL